MRRTVITLAAAAACVLGAGIGVASAAAHPADVNPTVLYTGPSNAGGIASGSVNGAENCAAPLGTCTDSMAGWYTDSFGQLFTQVNGTFTLNAEAEGIGISTVNGAPTPGNSSVKEVATAINGAIGLQLCDETHGEAVQLGAVYLGDGVFAVGYLEGSLNGLTANPCAGAGVLSGATYPGTTFVSLGEVPVGNTIEGQIKQSFDSRGNAVGVTFTAALKSGVANYTYFDPTWRFYPNEAGAGLQSDTTGLSAPAVNDLTDFTGVTATSSGVTTGLANWNAVEVAGSQDGIAPALLAPTMITPGTGSVCIWHPGHREYAGHFGHRVYYGPKGHRKFYWQKGDRHYYWVNGYRTCTGGGPSSFSVDAGTPVS